jgi:hypothetical protein
MKLLLQIIGWASVIGGLVMFILTIQNNAYVPGVAPNTYRLIAVGWLIGGVFGAAIPLGLAEVIGRLERLEERR